VKIRIGVLGVCVVAAAAVCGCSSTATAPAESGQLDVATLTAALSINGDGSADGIADSVGDEPLLTEGCGFEQIAETVVSHFDADQSGDLDASEKAELSAQYGDPESGVAAAHPNQGQPGKAAVLLEG
jgi:hypothetical protein